MLLDSCARRIDYLRISVTDRCNLRCVYCMPPEGIKLKRHQDLLTYEQIAAVARAGAGLGIARVRLTGGEPLVRRHIERLVALLRAIDGLKDISLTTNGVLLAPAARTLRAAGLDRINVSLDTLDPARYARLTRGGDIGRALEGLEAARAAGFEGIKVNLVVLEDTTPDEIEALRSFCARRGMTLQTIRHFTLFSRADGAGHPYACDRPPPCERCNRLRLTADGFLKPCLLSDDEVRVDFNAIEDSIRAAVRAKPLAGGSCTLRTMSAIGG